MSTKQEPSKCSLSCSFARSISVNATYLPHDVLLELVDDFSRLKGSPYICRRKLEVYHSNLFCLQITRHDKRRCCYSVKSSTKLSTLDQARAVSHSTQRASLLYGTTIDQVPSPRRRWTWCLYRRATHGIGCCVHILRDGVHSKQIKT